ncbi:MAG: competence type IV pilus minor pilin ComGD [Bacillota bacterium]|nr:competence type IV pilus minor pilin ComGD [Bacillota bacterium]
MKNDEAGFTLIEALIVLSILFITSFIAVFTVKPQFDMTVTEEFISDLEADLFYAQAYAISHQREVTINILNTQFYYYIRDRSDLPLIVERNYSKNIQIQAGSLPLYFKFLPDGNVNKFGSLYISCHSKVYRLTVLLGKGRFYIVKQ